MHFYSRNRHKPCVYACFFILFLSGCSGNYSKTPSPSDLAHNFIQVAATREGLNPKDTSFYKWKTEIPILIIDYTNSPFVNDYLRYDLLPRITNHTELKFIFEKPSPSELYHELSISFENWPPSWLPDVLRKKHSNCALNVTLDRTLKWGHSARVALEHGLNRKQLMHCLEEEFAQLLGLPNDSNRIVRTLFRDGSEINRLSKADLCFLKILYDPELTPGLIIPRNEIGPILNKLQTGYYGTICEFSK